MSRIGTSNVVPVRPTNNIYTGLAFISMAATLAALIYAIIRFHQLGVF